MGSANPFCLVMAWNWPVKHAKVHLQAVTWHTLQLHPTCAPHSQCFPLPSSSSASLTELALICKLLASEGKYPKASICNKIGARALARAELEGHRILEAHHQSSGSQALVRA